MLYNQIAALLLQKGVQEDKNSLTLSNPRRVNVEEIGSAEEISSTVVKVENHKTRKEAFVSSMEEFNEFFF